MYVAEDTEGDLEVTLRGMEKKKQKKEEGEEFWREKKDSLVEAVGGS